MSYPFVIAIVWICMLHHTVNGQGLDYKVGCIHDVTQLELDCGLLGYIMLDADSSILVEDTCSNETECCWSPDNTVCAMPTAVVQPDRWLLMVETCNHEISCTVDIGHVNEDVNDCYSEYGSNGELLIYACDLTASIKPTTVVTTTALEETTTEALPSSTSPITPADDEDDDGGDETNVGAIVGGTIGILLLILLSAGLSYYCYKKRHKPPAPEDTTEHRQSTPSVSKDILDDDDERFYHWVGNHAYAQVFDDSILQVEDADDVTFKKPERKSAISNFDTFF